MVNKPGSVCHCWVVHIYMGPAYLFFLRLSVGACQQRADGSMGLSTAREVRPQTALGLPHSAHVC